METLWFILVALMLVAYVALDGFDLGAGIIQPFVAKTDLERRTVLRSIGPVWDGNEVWLVAAGGAIFFAFPRLYASSFSGFYLPLTIVLWLLMLRGIGIELRSHVDSPLWASFFDFIFSISSLLLAIFFGAAIGNVVRGVPLGADGYFFEALWTDFRVSSSPGILDWYTILTGLLALAVLTTHGSNYVAMKTSGDVQLRARRAASFGWMALSVLTALSLLATLYVRPRVFDNFKSYPLGWLIPIVVVGALGSIFYFRTKCRDLAAFLSSTTYIAGMLAGAAFALYPYLLPSSSDPSYGLTVFNSQTGNYSLRVGLVWWSIGMTMAVCYFAFLYRSFSGKANVEENEAVEHS